MLKIKKESPDSIIIGDEIIKLKDRLVGTDYYVLQKDNKYFISMNKDDSSTLIGGFHYGLIPHNFKPINNINKRHSEKIRGINAYSIWDNKHRPLCEPESMVYIPKLKIWVDIYLLSSNHTDKGSKLGNHIASGYKSEGREIINNKDEFKYSDFVEVGNSLKKRMIKESEFVVAACGVKENSSANDLDDGTIKHISNYTSKYGLEQATGVQWIWGENKEEDGTEYAVILGGYRADGVSAGSRCSHWHYYVWHSDWNIGCRFASDCMKPA